jgi:hypothetical protein
MIRMSSSSASDRVPRIASFIVAKSASSSVRRRDDRPSIVSEKSAQSANASLRAPLSSGICGSECLLIPMNTAFVNLNLLRAVCHRCSSHFSNPSKATVVR